MNITLEPIDAVRPSTYNPRSAVAERLGLDSFHFVKRHAVFMLPALSVMIGLSFLSPRQVRRTAMALLAVSLIMMVLVLFIGVEVKGGRRWLSLAGLSAIPPSLYEAAAIDRASRWFVFWRITLPLVSPLLLIAIIFRTMEAFKTFDIAYVMASMDETELVAIRLYKMAFNEWQTGRSCALAYLMLLAVLAITNVYVKYLNRLKER